MIKTAVVLSLALIAASCAQAPQPAPVDQGPFVGFDLAKLPAKDRQAIAEASEDFNAVLAGRKPLHAVFDKHASLPSDGGTTFYQGHGYRLTILVSLSIFGQTKAVAYGPIIRFDASFAPGNTSEISDIRVYTLEAIGKLHLE